MIVIHVMGGLGNQLYQYVSYENSARWAGRLAGRLCVQAGGGGRAGVARAGARNGWRVFGMRVWYGGRAPAAS